MVLHKHEGMKSCVNPDCLKLGDDSENRLDQYRSRNQGFGKLTPEEVEEIKKTDKYTQGIGKKYGISRSVICLIRAGFYDKEGNE